MLYAIPGGPQRKYLQSAHERRGEGNIPTGHQQDGELEAPDLRGDAFSLTSLTK